MYVPADVLLTAVIGAVAAVVECARRGNVSKPTPPRGRVRLTWVDLRHDWDRRDDERDNERNEQGICSDYPTRRAR